MALTGIGIIFFVLAHMVGNWKIFLPDVAGVPDIDIYAEALRELLVPFLPAHVALWILRTGLIVAFLLHIHAAYVADPDEFSGPTRALSRARAPTWRPTTPAGRCAGAE